MGKEGRYRISKHGSCESPQRANISYRLMAARSVPAVLGGYHYDGLNLIGGAALPRGSGDCLPRSGHFNKVILEGDDAGPNM